METDISVGSRFALFAGSAQAIPGGNVLIGWASSTTCSPARWTSRETGCGELVAEGHPDHYFTYRALKTNVPATAHVEVAAWGRRGGRRSG